MGVVCVLAFAVLQSCKIDPIPAPVLRELEITPGAVVLREGGAQQYSVTGLMTDSTTRAPDVVYSATGGTITPSGLYVAGATSGTFVVIATALEAAVADTSSVTISVIEGISITPASVVLDTAKTQQFIASGRLTGGATVPVSVTYSATGGSITAQGLLSSGALADTFLVIATQVGGTFADTATVIVTPTAVSVPGTVVAPWLAEDFSGYTSTSHMLSNPRGIYRTSEDQRTADIALDIGSGFGSSDRSMKFTFPDQTNNLAGRCTIDYSISRWIKLPTPVKEVWAEIWVKYSSNFNTRVPTAWGCAGNADYKFVFFAIDPAAGRWQVKNATYGSHWSPNHPGGNGDTFITTNSGNGGLWFDGQWHRLRWHARVSTTVSSADGAFEWWLDDVKQNYPSNINTNAGGLPVNFITDLRLGANLNLGPSQTQTLNWGLVRLYDRNPGW